MSTRIDWQREIDESFGQAPDRPAADYVASGHRALRRRRAVAGIAGLVAVVVLGGVGFAALPDGPRQEAPPAGEPGRDHGDERLAPMVTAAGDVRQVERELGVFAAPNSMAVTVLAASGELVHKPGWVVEELHALVGQDDRRVWAVSVSPSDGGVGQWILLTWRPGSLAAAMEEPGRRFASFGDWVADAWAEKRGVAPPPPARLEDGRVVPLAGFEVLEQVVAPEQAAAWGPVEDQVAVKLQRPDGSVLFARVDAEGATAVEPDRLAQPTMASFLDHLAERGASREGRR